LPDNQLPPCPSEHYWEIKPGDTLYLIARRTGTTVEELIRLNPGITPESLQVGEIVCLPETAPCPSGVYWEISPGDTLYTIAQATGTTVEILQQLNPGLDPENLQVGQSICLPQGS